MVEGVDPTTIAHPALRDVVRLLMNQVEDLTAQLQEQRAETQRLRDELQRLKGEQGQPRILPNRPARDISSEAERNHPRPWKKRAKHPTLRVDRTERVLLDPADLPADAIFKGYQRVIVQDIRLTTETVCFEKAVWYSPSERRSYRAINPHGYEGQFGPHVKALVWTLAFESGLSEPKIHQLLQLAGMQISRGQISTILHTIGALFADERQAMLAAGLQSTPWHHIDATATRVAGTNHHCHILTNPLYTVYTTKPQKDRLHVLDVLRGDAPRTFVCDPTAERLMRLMDVPRRAQKAVIKRFPRGVVVDEATLDAWIATAPHMKATDTKKWIKDALAIAAYHAQRAPPVPIVQLLIGDDAPQWTMLTEDVALWWVHDGRAYKRLLPRLEHHKTLVAEILTQFWALYHALRVYQAAPNPEEAERLRAQFAALVAQRTGYKALDERLTITAQKRRGLLMVLEHPEIPLHTNPAELGARRRVRKRDVSFGARTQRGAAVWDIGHTLTATAQQLGINIHAYVRDRICGDTQVVPLADVITARAQLLNLGTSWQNRRQRPDWMPVSVAMWHA